MASTVISQGPPPLTEEAADCAIDMIDFMAAVVRGVDTIDVTPAVRQAWRAHLITYYPMLNPADRYFFATAQYALSALQATWPQLGDYQRDMYRSNWASMLPAILQFAAPVVGDGTQAPAAYPSQSAPSPYGTAPYPSYNASEGASAGDYVNQILAQQDADMRQAQAQGPEAAAALQRDQDSRNAQMLSDMANMRYQSQMQVAQNMRA
jgi:hypothetical protein